MPSSTKKNLVLVEGAGPNAGQVIRWYNNAPTLKSVLAAPGLGKVYGGGVSFSAFDFTTGKKLWTQVEDNCRPHHTHPRQQSGLSRPRARRRQSDDLGGVRLRRGGRRSGDPAKAMVKLDIDGKHDDSWLTKAGEAAFGQSVVDHNGKLYLAAGGSDFVAEYDKGPGTNGARGWVRDTSGSAQAVAVLDDKLVVGGHFY